VNGKTLLKIKSINTMNGEKLDNLNCKNYISRYKFRNKKVICSCKQWVHFYMNLFKNESMENTAFPER
jgi:hypothetical protein